MILCIYLVYSASFLKTFRLIAINEFILTELIFLRFLNKSYCAPQKLMHTPASRQPGARYAQILGVHAQVVTKPSSATSGQLTSRLIQQKDQLDD